MNDMRKRSIFHFDLSRSLIAVSLRKKGIEICSLAPQVSPSRQKLYIKPWRKTKLPLILCGRHSIKRISSDITDIRCNQCIKEYKLIQLCLPYFLNIVSKNTKSIKLSDRKISLCTGLDIHVVIRLRKKLKIPEYIDSIKSENIKKREPYISQPGEIWKQVNKEIEASNFGHFRSLKSQRLLSVHLNKKTYDPNTVKLRRNVARIIFKLFKNEPLHRKDLVRFRDGDHSNLHVDNLYRQRPLTTKFKD